jgi:hypothetical protein
MIVMSTSLDKQIETPVVSSEMEESEIAVGV